MLREIVALCGVLAFAACTPPQVTTRAVTLADGTVSAVAPEGYCVDSAASQPRRDFAVFLPCAALDGSVAPPEAIGLVTVQVGPDASGTIAADEGALRDFLTSDAGTELLSRNGNPNDITILSTQAFGDQVMVYFSDDGTPPMAGLQAEEWRAFRDIGGRLVTIGVRGLRDAPLPDGMGAGLLKLIIAGLAPTQTASDDATPEA